MEKGISGCATLTELSVHGNGLWSKLPPQYSSASVRAAMALQSSLMEVELEWCSFDGKSDIGVTVLCVVCAWCVVRDRGGGGRDWVCVFAYVCLGVHSYVHVCVCMCLNVFALCVHIACGTCPFCLHNCEPCSFSTFLCVSLTTHVTVRSVCDYLQPSLRFDSVRGPGGTDAISLPTVVQ